jgi:hypothetical protein
LSTGLAGLNPIRDIANVRTTVLLAEAQFNVDNTKWLAGTGTDASWRYLEYRRHLRSHHDAARADRNHGGDRARRHLHLQAIRRGNQVQVNAILSMHPDVIDTFYRFVTSGSTSEPQIFWQGRNGRLLGKQVLEWSTLTTTGQRLAILGYWSGFTIVNRLGAQIELIPRLLGATNRFPTGAARALVHLAIFVGVSPSQTRCA